MQKHKGCRNLMPTPTANAYGRNKGGSNPDGPERPSLETMARRNGGQLNPTWVEWLMGFPLGWTACEPSATRSSHPSRSEPSACSTGGCTENDGNN